MTRRLLPGGQAWTCCGLYVLGSSRAIHVSRFAPECSAKSIQPAPHRLSQVGLGVIRPGQLALLTGSSHLHLGVTDKV